MDALGRFVEPVDVLLEPEDPARVGPDPLEDAVAVEQAVIEDADLGVGLVEELAADVDLGARFGAVLPLQSRRKPTAGPPRHPQKSGQRGRPSLRFGLRRAERPGRPAGQCADRALPKS